MHQPDAITLAGFDDDPQSTAPAAPGCRPATRPRPDPSSHPQTDSIALVVFDSGMQTDLSTNQQAALVLPRLAFDLGFFDPETAAFLVVYPAGTPLDALKPRTVATPALEAGSPITSIVLYARTPGKPDPVPYRTFQFSQDIRGQQLTLRLGSHGSAIRPHFHLT